VYYLKGYVQNLLFRNKQKPHQGSHFFFQIPEASVREFFTLISNVRNFNIFLHKLYKIKANWRERVCIVTCASENSETGIC